MKQTRKMSLFDGRVTITEEFQGDGTSVTLMSIEQEGKYDLGSAEFWEVYRPLRGKVWFNGVEHTLEGRSFGTWPGRPVVIRTDRSAICEIKRNYC